MEKKKAFVRRDVKATKTNGEKTPVKQEQDKALVLNTEGEKKIDKANSLVVSDQMSYEEATNFLLWAKERAEKIDEEKGAIVNPAKAIIKKETARWKPAEDVLKQINEILRPKMLKFINEREAKAQAELDALRKKQQAGQIKDAAKIEAKLDAIHSQVPAKTVHTGTGSAQIRQVKKLVIKDPALVPDQYWVIDEAKLRDAVVKQGLVVPGADWEFDNTIAII